MVKADTVDKRETALTIRTPIQARYIRIQLESTKSDGYLSLAEVQVFQEASSEIQHYHDGSPIVGGTYQSEESLDENFRGIRARGYGFYPYVILYVEIRLIPWIAARAMMLTAVVQLMIGL